MSFESLTPDIIVTAVEQACGLPMTGLAIALPSYINRVYEVRAKDGTKLIAKFYRHNRWTSQAIMDEHQFLLDCAMAEVPVVAPIKLTNGTTLFSNDTMNLAVFPKRAGRQLEICDESYWPRIGSLLARMHLCGEKNSAAHRVTISPTQSALNDVEFLCHDIIPEPLKAAYFNTAKKILDFGTPLFADLECIRIHGDCHCGNILDRLDEGLQLIDFDDMAMGPPVQDLWLLLPERAANARYEIDLFVEGYQRFRKFDRAGLAVIETLRAMRMIYFCAWCSRQTDDFQFKTRYPDWGTGTFWQRETNDLREQLGFILDAI